MPAVAIRLSANLPGFAMSYSCHSVPLVTYNPNPRCIGGTAVV